MNGQLLNKTVVHMYLFGCDWVIYADDHAGDVD